MILSYLSRLFKFILALSVLITSGSFGLPEEAEPTLNAPLWSRWVHEHWVWENEGTQESAMEFVNGFKERNIPVGAVIIDRPWATDSNTFIPDPERYPDLEEYVDTFHGMDVRVIMWATSVINETASNFNEGLVNGYYLDDGKTVKWWGGKGAFIDYTNPDAVEWWHSQMDNILDMGIDGWKVDGTDPYVLLLYPAKGMGDDNITWEEYSAQSYGDFFNYTREKLGNDRVISARPVDDQLTEQGIPLVFTDRTVNFAGWVGDNDNTWGGLKHALNNMFVSAEYNFVSYGSDIGGFRKEEDPDKNVFTRWAQLGAFCCVMENGGGGEHRPWMYDEQTVDIYREFTVLHTELIPYIYSSAAYSYELEKPTMRPQNGDYIYMLGDNLLVAPFTEEGDTRRVTFPSGEWIYLFDETQVFTKGSEVVTVPLEEFPVYIRNGSIIPMEIDSSLTGFGTEYSAGYTTVLVYPQNGTETFGLYEDSRPGTMLSYTKSGLGLSLSSTQTDRQLLFRVYGETAESVTLGDTKLTKVNSAQELSAVDAGFFTENGITWIAVKDATQGVKISVK